MEKHYNQIEDKNITLLSCDCYCTSEDEGWTQNVGVAENDSDCEMICSYANANFASCE